MNATVNRRPGSATLSGVRLTPTLAPRAFSSIACSEASGFKGLKVSFVYKFVYSTTAVRQSCRSLRSPRLNATQAAAPAASIPIDRLVEEQLRCAGLLRVSPAALQEAIANIDK